MLSGETAAGSYPVEALKTMALIAERAEREIDYEKQFRSRVSTDLPNITNAISHATVTTATDLKAARYINRHHHRTDCAHDIEIPSAVPDHLRYAEQAGLSPAKPFVGRNADAA